MMMMMVTMTILMMMIVMTMKIFHSEQCAGDSDLHLDNDHDDILMMMM